MLTRLIICSPPGAACVWARMVQPQPGRLQTQQWMVYRLSASSLLKILVKDHFCIYVKEYCCPQVPWISTRSIRDVSNVGLPTKTGRVWQHADPANPLQCQETPRQGKVPWVPLEATLGPKGWFNWESLENVTSVMIQSEWFDQFRTHQLWFRTDLIDSGHVRHVLSYDALL